MAQPSSTVTDLTLANVDRARTVIPPYFLDSPQYEDDLVNAALGRRVTLKVETLNPIRSFKGRGVSFALSEVPAGTTVVCASSGNFGQALAYVGRSRGLNVVVYTSAGVNPVKRARMEAFGATVIEVDGSTDARDRARSAAAEHAGHLVIDGSLAAIAEGAGTIAQELTRAGTVDTLVAPVGDGSLVTGLALWFRAHAPATRIVGVIPAAAPAIHRSFHAGEPVTVTPASMFAEGINSLRPHPDVLARLRTLVDDIVLVDEPELREAMELVARHLSVLAEPAGVAGVAAIARKGIEGERVATVITGANPNPGHR